MNTEEYQSPSRGAPLPGLPVLLPDGAGSGNEEEPAIYKSFKKKYRKMRLKFEEVMKESNDLYVEEQLAVETAKRLAQENDRLLDFLLEQNNSAQLPEDKRFDLTTGPSGVARDLVPIPPLVTPEERRRAEGFEAPMGQAIYKEVLEMLADSEKPKGHSKPTRSYLDLLAAAPAHLLGTSAGSQELAEDLKPLEGLSHPIQYLSLEQIDNYLYDVDTNSGPPAQMQIPSAHELSMKNPHSVYNWLRRNEPKIFLQDGEGSEKSSDKPGALRGAGKRARIPAPSKPDALEFVEEDGIGYDTALAGPTKGKRKRGDTIGEEDGGYTPKAGRADNPKTKKPRKKKSSEVGGESAASLGTPTATKKGKGKSRASSSPPSPPSVSFDAGL